MKQTFLPEALMILLLEGFRRLLPTERYAKKLKQGGEGTVRSFTVCGRLCRILDQITIKNRHEPAQPCFSGTGFPEAVGLITQAIALYPHNPVLYFSSGNVFGDLSHVFEGQAGYDRTKANNSCTSCFFWSESILLLSVEDYFV
jgi:hypothetical protein